MFCALLGQDIKLVLQDLGPLVLILAESDCFSFQKKVFFHVSCTCMYCSSNLSI